MIELSQRDESSHKAWAGALRKHQLLYPDERVVSFLARNFSDRQANSSRRAIDIGFGSGRHISLLLDYGFQTYGIDYTEEAVRLVNNNLGHRENLKDIVLGDFRTYVFPHAFDVMIMWGNLFFIPPSEMVMQLKSMESALAIGGKIFLNFRSRDNFFYGLGQEVEDGCFILDERAGAYKGMCYSFLDLPDIESLVAKTRLSISHIEKTTLLENMLSERSEQHAWYQVELEPA